MISFKVPMVGKTLGTCRIVEKIGRGGMGTAYRGVDEMLDRQVAIKVVGPELVEEDLVRRRCAPRSTWCSSERRCRSNDSKTRIPNPQRPAPEAGATTP